VGDARSPRAIDGDRATEVSSDKAVKVNDSAIMTDRPPAEFTVYAVNPDTRKRLSFGFFN
jgi:hypothetical protein